MLTIYLARPERISSRSLFYFCTFPSMLRRFSSERKFRWKGQCPDYAHARASCVFSSKDNRTVTLTRQAFLPDRTVDGHLLFPLSRIINLLNFRRSLSSYLKEQYPVTAHAPNFEFWTGCREIKKYEESKRTLKNPFASRLAGFNTTLKLLRITDQWYIVPVKFRFGQNLDFLALLLLPLVGGPKNWKHFDADWRLISSASFHTSSDNCERNTLK